LTQVDPPVLGIGNADVHLLADCIERSPGRGYDVRPSVTPARRREGQADRAESLNRPMPGIGVLLAHPDVAEPDESPECLSGRQA
jgi:hypothetical protein